MSLLLLNMVGLCFAQIDDADEESIMPSDMPSLTPSSLSLTSSIVPSDMPSLVPSIDPSALSDEGQLETITGFMTLSPYEGDGLTPEEFDNWSSATTAFFASLGQNAKLNPVVTPTTSSLSEGALLIEFTLGLVTSEGTSTVEEAKNVIDLALQSADGQAYYTQLLSETNDPALESFGQADVTFPDDTFAGDEDAPTSAPTEVGAPTDREAGSAGSRDKTITSTLLFASFVPLVFL